MEVILLENISKLGGLGDKVNVRPGFGRNYLVPQGKAVPATARNIAVGPHANSLGRASDFSAISFSARSTTVP